MRTNRTRSVPLLLSASLSAAGSLALAGSIETGDSRRPLNGAPQPEPTAGSVIAVSFNPSVRLIVQEGENLVSLLGRLEEEIEEISIGEYLAEVETEGRLFGLEIRRADGSELNRLSMRKDDPSLPDIRLELERPGLAARIRFPDALATGGELSVAINGEAVAVDTMAPPDPESLVRRVALELSALGFQGLVSGLELVIFGTSEDDEDIEELAIRSTDVALTEWEAALVPKPVGF